MAIVAEGRSVTEKKTGKADAVTVTGLASGNGEVMGDADEADAKRRGRGVPAIVTDGGIGPEGRHGNEAKRDNEQGLDSLCCNLQSLERQRRFALKQCIRGENAITAFVAWNACGFHTGIPTEAEREKLWKKAGKLIKAIDEGEVRPDLDKNPADGEDSVEVEDANAGGESPPAAEIVRVQDDSSDECARGADAFAVTGVVRISQISRKAWSDYEKALYKQMEELAGQLPVAPWLNEPECRGISLGMLATIVGESGNLSNYPNPAKLWRRLFGAPIEKNGKVMMPSRWRLEKGLTAEEWEEAGYSPQRHATMQQIKENIVRQNGDGPYRKRYDEAKARTRETHPEWWQCSKCDGKGKVGRKKCSNCKGTGEVALHAHRHAQLLAAKRFVRDLWNRWR